jgi:hypothetical protein
MILSAHDTPLNGLRCMDSAMYGVHIVDQTLWNKSPCFRNNFLLFSFRRCRPLEEDWYELYVSESLDSAVYLEYNYQYPRKPKLCVRDFFHWNLKGTVVVMMGDYIWKLFGIERVQGELFEHFKMLKREHLM